MRITGRQLRRIIQEEVERMINEEDAGPSDTIVAGAKEDRLGALKGTSLGNRLADFKAQADEVVKKLESNAYMNISLGSDIKQPFTTPSGKGILKLLIPARNAPSQTIQIDVLDQSGVSKLGMNADGSILIRAIVNRIKRTMLPREQEQIPMMSYTVKLPFTFEPGKLILGNRGGPVIGFGGGEDYTADKLNGGISIMGIGFR